MSKLHIANTNFEWELVQDKSVPLESAFAQHPIFLQLQFLPFLYAGPEDGVVVTGRPNEEFWEVLNQFGVTAPKMHLFSEKDFSAYQEIESWGPSLMISQWAQKHHLEYSIPPWPTVLQVNSKAFSYQTSPKLSHSALLSDEAQTRDWLRSILGKIVFKTCYGVSGKGHLVLDLDKEVGYEKLWSFLKREWNKNRPVIAEPWVSRLFDFSTQWEINNDVRYLGATVCENDPKGAYRCNYAGNEVQLFGKWIHFLEEHRKVVQPILMEIARLGHFGNIGIDAMVFESNGAPHLHPVVEINARKTMGWVALQIQKKQFPENIISLQFSSSDGTLPSLLPDALIKKDKSVIKFSKRLCVKICN